jgi:hypothetical protein
MLHTGNTVRPLSHDTCVRILALGHLTSRRSCPGSWLWAVSNFVAFCPDWPPAVGPKIHIFCPDRDQGFPAIARGPGNTTLSSVVASRLRGLTGSLPSNTSPPSPPFPFAFPFAVFLLSFASGNRSFGGQLG